MRLSSLLCTAALLFLVCAFPLRVRANPCRDLAACCRIFDFSAPSTIGSAPFTADTILVPQGNNSFWWSTGVALYINQSDATLGLFNSSRIPFLPITGADYLMSSTDRLVLAAFQNYNTTLYKNTHTLRFQLLKKPVCIATVSTLRSTNFNSRTTVQMIVLRDGAVVGSFTHAWALNQANADSYDFGNLDTDQLQVNFLNGYGALASVEVCYHAPLGYDACDQCGGDGVGCASPGQSCNTGMPGVCALGTYNFNLVCVPTMSNMPEQCNGVDDNCDGLVDNADFGTWQCGVGQCKRSVSQCQNGVMVPSSACVPGQPTAEVCNGLDDDCDGVVDNGVCQAASTSAAPSPSAVPSPSPSPSASVPFLLPMLDCVMRLDASTYEARFGYLYSGPGAAAAVDIAEGTQNTLMQGTDLLDGQTTHFVAGAPVEHAFSVTFGASEMVVWRVGLSGQALQSAVASAGSRQCDADAPFEVEAVQPLFERCVSMVGSRCTVQLSYHNPNPQSVEVAEGVGSNWFAPAPDDRRQPRVFWPGLVQNAAAVEFDCSLPAWTLTWTLTVGGQSRSAQASAASLCT